MAPAGPQGSPGTARGGLRGSWSASAPATVMRPMARGGHNRHFLSQSQPGRLRRPLLWERVAVPLHTCPLLSLEGPGQTGLGLTQRLRSNFISSLTIPSPELDIRSAGIRALACESGGHDPAVHMQGAPHLTLGWMRGLEAGGCAGGRMHVLEKIQKSGPEARMLLRF